MDRIYGSISRFTTSQPLAPNVQDGSICIQDIRASFQIVGGSGDLSSILISVICALHLF